MPAVEQYGVEPIPAELRTAGWRELFAVDRTKIRGGLWDYLKENKDYPYYLIRDRFAGAGQIDRVEGNTVYLNVPEENTIEV